MAMSFVVFVPFDDSRPLAGSPGGKSTTRLPPVMNVTAAFGKPNYNTSVFDNFRQGVEIITPAHLLGSSQPKLWDGNPDLSHQRSQGTFGGALDYVEDNSLGQGTSFQDKPKFDSVSFIVLGQSYPTPITFNDGPAESVEAQIEPLTIPFRMTPTNEGPYYAHQIHGNFEGGQNNDSLNRDGGRVDQFIPYAAPSTVRYFLDQGGGTFGTVVVQPYIASDVQRVITPYDDTAVIVTQLTNQTGSFQAAIAPLQVNQELDFRPNRTRSAAAGYTYYAPNSALYGTDSTAFGGWIYGN